MISLFLEKFTIIVRINWQILFLVSGPKFSPIYDNGASLGFRFEDNQLMKIATDNVEMNKYTKNTKVKAGLFEKKNVKAKDLLTYLSIHYPKEFDRSISKLQKFNFNKYKQFIQSFDLLSEAQKMWLQNVLPFRRQKMLEWIGKE